MLSYKEISTRYIVHINVEMCDVYTSNKPITEAPMFPLNLKTRTHTHRKYYCYYLGSKIELEMFSPYETSKIKLKFDIISLM